jgi:hypothetical protein
MNTHSRRKFIGTLAASASLTGITGTVLAETATPQPSKLLSEADDWFKSIKGSHRIVYDAPEPHGGLPVIWSWAYYMTNNQTGTDDSDMTSMVVLRHNAIPYALKDDVWKKYNLGEVFNIDDAKTQAKSLRNNVYEPQEGDFPLPVIDGIKAQQARGAMYCVCDLAISVYSGAVASGMGLNAEDVRNDWLAAVHPGVQVVPSGVWALGRAQENGCGYIYAGG